MTPFDTWYAREVAPKLPTDTPPPIRKASREAMAACWNAALDAAIDHGWKHPSDEWVPSALEPLKVTL